MPKFKTLVATNGYIIGHHGLDNSVSIPDNGHKPICLGLYVIYLKSHLSDPPHIPYVHP